MRARHDASDISDPATHATTLPARFRGALITPHDASFEDARHVFNQRLAGHPAIIAQCAGVADVIAALRLADELALDIAVRCGGHSVAGWSTIDDGLVIDLTRMRNVLVDPATSTAWVGGGTRAIDLIVEAAEFGLAPVTGVTAKVGLGGLLLGLGEGYMTPRYGFGVDTVLELELVTADGTVVRASANENPDLFWAMRGAGANFGVVTAMRLQLFPAPERAVGGFVTFGEEDVPAVTRHLWHSMQHGSEHCYPMAKYHLDAEGRMRVAVIPGHVGPAEVAEREVEALRSCGTPVSDDLRVESYLDLINEVQGGGGRDANPDAPRRQAWDLYHFPFGQDAERQMEFLIAQAQSLGAAEPFLYLWRTVAPPARLASAAPRHQGIALFIAAYWNSPHDDARLVPRVAELASGFVESGLVMESPNAMNHSGVNDEERVRRVYGAETYTRLAVLKAIYDPQNRFRRNFNVRPA
jgi:FAD/FMN-containing dehydrogenase